jgi:DUF3102 family protein
MKEYDVTTMAAINTDTQVARPLRVLVPLIQEELEAGESAGLEHYRRAGEMLIEAKSQVKHGEWGAWLKRNFTMSAPTAHKYMRLANIPRRGEEFRPRTLNEAVGDLRRGRAERDGAVGVSEKAVRQIVSRVDVDRLAAERQSREREAKLVKDLAHQLIDIGYRVLAAKLHPDHGGSKEAMARLNAVRSLLKGAV